MFVVSVCALSSGAVLKLNWWPMVRDCTFYSLSIFVMLIVICNDLISWPEALFMMLLYVVYCVALHFNSSLERWAHSLNLPIKLPTKDEQSALVTYKNAPEQTYNTDVQKETAATQPAPAQEQAYDAYSDPNASWDPNAAWSDTSKAAQPAVAATDNWGGDQWGNGGEQNYGYSTGPDQYEQQQAGGGGGVQSPSAGGAPTTVVAAGGAVDEYYKPREPRPCEQNNPLEKPTGGSQIEVIAWAIVYPIHYMCRMTMPDVKTEKYRNWYPLTFCISMIWISFYSYFMVWMIVIIGTTLGIPDTVMGLTFVAAGVSVPDALSSIAVIKEGYGDMAVSNAVGSNVFDILICLGLPWFIQTAIIKPGSHVNVISKGLSF